MKSDKVTFQVKFWALVGPFICLLTLFVFFIKGATTPAWLPFILIMGVPLCWKWTLKGFFCSTALLFSILAFHYSEIPLDERFWHLGMGISAALSLLITALSFDEMEALVKGLKVESRSRLENLWKLDEKLQQASSELRKKKERIRELNVRIRSYQKLIDHSTEELVEIREKYDQLQNDFYQTKREKEALELRLQEEKEAPPAAAKYQQLRQQFEEKQSLLDETRKELFMARERIMSLEKEQDEMNMYELSEVEAALERHLLNMEKEQRQQEEQHQMEIEALHEMLGRMLK